MYPTNIRTLDPQYGHTEETNSHPRSVHFESSVFNTQHTDNHHGAHFYCSSVDHCHCHLSRPLHHFSERGLPIKSWSLATCCCFCVSFLTTFVGTIPKRFYHDCHTHPFEHYPLTIDRQHPHGQTTPIYAVPSTHLCFEHQCQHRQPTTGLS